MYESAARTIETYEPPRRPDLHVVINSEIITDGTALGLPEEGAQFDALTNTELMADLKLDADEKTPEDERFKQPLLELVASDQTVRHALDSLGHGSCAGYLASHQEIILTISRQVCNGVEGSVFSPEDLAQEVCIELVKKFESRGPDVFQPSLIKHIARNRLTDAIRRFNRFSRMESILVKHAASLQAQEVGRHAAENMLTLEHPNVAPERTQKVVSHVYSGANRQTTVHIEELQGFDVASYDDHEPQSSSDKTNVKQMKRFITNHLANEPWHSKKRERYIAMAQARFIHGRELATIGRKFGVTESRISQIFTREIIPALQRSVKESGFGSDDVAELLYSTA